MRLLEMTLDGCIRLALNNIRFLRFTPTQMYQLILGTNGSGKSSIINEVSPLPADSKNFFTGGSKTTKWEHKGSEYLISSTFKTKAGKHSFIKDGEELNPGGTQSVNRELAQMEFGYDDDIHELITGQIKFSTMSTAERRKWMTKLCDTDFTFVIGYFNEMSRSARDALGYSKGLADRMVTETNKLRALGDDYVAWAAEAEELQQELDILYNNRSNRNLSGGENRIQQMLDWECRMAARILDMGNPVAGKFRSLEHARERLTAIDKEQELVKHSIQWTTEALEDLQRLKATVDSGGVGSLEEAEEEMATLSRRADYLRGCMTEWPNISGVDGLALNQAINNAREELTAVLREIPNNLDNQFNMMRVKDTREQRIQLKKELEQFQNRVAKEESILEHISTVNHNECPNCEHKWLPGNTEQIRRAAEINLREFQQKVNDTQIALTIAEQYLEQAGEFSAFYQRYRALVANNPTMGVFWDSMLEHNGVNTNPQGWIRKFNSFSRDAETYSEWEVTNRRLDQLTLSVEAMKKANGQGELQTRIDQNAEKIAALTEQLVQLGRDHDEVKEIVSKASQLEDLGRQLEAGSQKKEEAFRDYVVELRDDTIQEITRTNQSRLAFLNTKLSERKTIEDLLKDLELSREEAQLRHEVLKAIADELSPKDGIIAEQMIGFIKAWSGDINSVIDNVWTYSLEVLPCGEASGELDYRFPVSVKGNEPSPDVLKTSAGQKEMIDFAFMLVAMLYLRLEHFPLHLDELGHFFDETHKVNVMNFVKDLVETKGFSQVFMISHYAISHGAFTNAEVLVMDPSNVTLPARYNKHVTIE